MLKDRGKEDKMTGYYMSRVETRYDDPEFPLGLTEAAAEKLKGPEDQVVYMTIPTGPDGLPTVNAIICKVTSKDLKKFDDAVDDGGVTRCDPLPDMALDSISYSMAKAPKDKFLAKVEEKLGATIKSEVNTKMNTQAWREVINHIGKKGHSDFDIRWLEERGG